MGCKNKMEDLIRSVIKSIGDNPDRDGLIDTPKRVSTMFKEIFKGYDINRKPRITVFDNGKDGIIYDQMIVDTGSFVSFCEHHILPFYGEYYFAYIPDKKILGLSKVARLIDFHSSRLQIQERLVKDIVDDLETLLNPKGIALVLKSEHMCKTIRGIKNKGIMITSDMRGLFRVSEPRNEFLNFVNNKK